MDNIRKQKQRNSQYFPATSFSPQLVKCHKSSRLQGTFLQDTLLAVDRQLHITIRPFLLVHTVQQY